MNVRKPKEAIGLLSGTASTGSSVDMWSAAESAGGTSTGSPATARPPMLPALSPQQQHSPSSVMSRGPVGLANGMPTPRFVQPVGFVVHDCIDGAHKRTQQEEKTEAARESTFMALGPAPMQFYRTRTLAPATSGRWEQPLPAIAADGSYMLCRPAAAPPERSCVW